MIVFQRSNAPVNEQISYPRRPIGFKTCYRLDQIRNKETTPDPILSHN